jgi:glycerol uptake facilitator-like aquaporin
VNVPGERLLQAAPPTHSLSRRLAAEALGTAFLLASVVGSGIMAERLAAGNSALALLANAIATGAALFGLIMAFGPISGAHFNSAVSLVMALRRELSWRVLPAYLTVQVAGGVLGVWLAHAMFGVPVIESGVKVRSGSGLWLAETVASFGLVTTIIALKDESRAAVAGSVALYITAAYWFTASTSFANPAVTIARSFTDSFSGIRPADAPTFIVAQLCGAILAAALASWLFVPIPARTAASETK